MASAGSAVEIAFLHSLVRLVVGFSTSIYGAILLHRDWPGSSLNLDEINEKALRNLPESDEWPFLPRSMFSLTENSGVPLDYARRVLHFGASYKQVESDWEQWLAKFEALLMQLQGSFATVQMQSDLFGELTYKWINRIHPESGQSAVWEFLGGRRTFE